MANIITGSRILLSAALLFFPALSPAFYALYAAAGLSDMLDGLAARKTNTATAFGAKLDTVADFCLFAACAIKLFPLLKIPLWLMIWVAVIAAIKAVNLISGFITQKKFVAAHTVMNKITGVCLFLLPFTLALVELKISASVVCALATFAAVQEGHYIRTGRISPESADA